MRKPQGSLYATALVVLVCTLSLAIPVIRGSSPVDSGLHLSGGVIVTYRPDFSSRLDGDESRPREELLALAKETVASRLYRNLNTTPDVVVRGDESIVVSIPATENRDRILALVGETYHLTLRLVLHRYAEPVAGPELFAYRGDHLVLAEPEFSGGMLDERYIRVETAPYRSSDAGAMAPEVAFRFMPPHDESFANFTGDHVGRELAILLDDRVEWVGTIENAIAGSGALAGGYSLDQANDVAMMLKSGTLPISLEVESLSAVGPTLGQEIKDRGAGALVLSLALLAALIAVAYLHRSALVITGLASLACLLLLIAGMTAAFDLTLDMVGIAGIILSVGMGMDAFILVFESLETRSASLTPGQLKTHRERISRSMYSFAGEGRTLFHANATTLVVISLLLTTERLRSFALFILAGICASVLTIFMTREILGRTYGRIGDLGFTPLAWLRVARPRIFRFRKAYFATVAAALVLTGWLVIGETPSDWLGGDFKQGTQLILFSEDESSTDAAIAEVRRELSGTLVRKQQMGQPDEGRYLVTLGTPIATVIGGAQHESDGLTADRLARIFAAHSVELEKLSSIDSRVSSGRLARSLQVLILSFFFLAIYFIACQEPINRFFASTARQAPPSASRGLVFAGILLAVVVDVSLSLAALAALGIPLSLPVIAGLLALIGYSVNDSVVLWSHLQRPEGDAAGSALERVTRGVDRMLSRTLLTSLSTMVPALTILLVGLEPLAGFAWTMIVGTIAGTLSSIFIVGSFAVTALERQAGGVARAGRSIGKVHLSSPSGR